MPNRTSSYLLLLCAALQSGCYSLQRIYDHTKNRSDLYTNVSAFVNAFPTPSCRHLELSAASQQGLAARVKELPAATGFAPLPTPRIAEHGDPPTLPPLTIVNTDVDDTVQAFLWDRGRYPVKTAYPGVAELLRGQGQVLIALTARTQSSAEGVREKFCRLLHICEHVNVSGRKHMTADSIEMGLQKADVLLDELRGQQGQARVLFNGDSGQADWIAALVVRDVLTHIEGELAPAFPYATIHDVRPWSPAHRTQLLMRLGQSCHLQAIYRRARKLPEAGCSATTPVEPRLTQDLARLLTAVGSALPAASQPRRLDADYLRTQRIVLFRTHVELALTLEEEGCLSTAGADRIVGAAATAVCFQNESDNFFFDSEARKQLEARLEARYGASSEKRPPAPAISRPGLCAPSS